MLVRSLRFHACSQGAAMYNRPLRQGISKTTILQQIGELKVMSKTFQEQYQEKKMSAEKLLELIRDRDYIVSAQAAGEPIAIMSKLQHLKNTGVKDVIL